MEKLNNIHRIRNRNYFLFIENLPDNMWRPKSFGFTSNFAYPLIDEDRHKIVICLEAAGVETRPLICGDMQTQPYIMDIHSNNKIALNAQIVDKFGFYIPNHANVNEDDVINICNIIRSAKNG